jgi:hypothetical protein
MDSPPRSSLSPLPPPQGVYDEMLDASGPRAHYAPYADWLASTTPEQMAGKRAEADLIFRRIGITFSVYGDEDGTERLIPSDVVPRIIAAGEWDRLERGLVQRVTAINRFLADIYHGQEILKAGLIPEDQILANDQFSTAMIGTRVPRDVYAQIVGVDIVRHGDGSYYVLEDNLRVPSGVSYMLSNRKMMMRLFPDLFRRYHVRPVEHYPALLLQTLRAATEIDSPTVVLLTPGRYNSAYFEHAFLAQQMGVELVEGQDLFVKDACVYMRTTEARAASTSSTGASTRVPRPPRVPAGLDAGRARAARRLPARQRRDLQRDRHRVPTTSRSTRTAGDDPVLPREEPILRTCPTWQCRRPTTWRTCWRTCRARGQGGARRRRGTGCWSDRPAQGRDPALPAR